MPTARAAPAWPLAAAALLALAAAAPGQEGGAAAPPRAVELVVDSNGFPGVDRDEASRQVVLTDGRRLRALDPAARRGVYVSLAERLVSEVDLARRELVLHPFEEYEALRRKRERTRAVQLEQFRTHAARADAEGRRELEAELRDLGLRPDGAVEARVERPGETREVVLDVDGAPRAVALRRVRIRENEAARPVLDLWVTDDVELPVDLLAFYRELGLFSAPVAARLREVRSAVVDATVVLDDGSFRRTTRSVVRAVRTDPPCEPADLIPPPGLTEVDPDAPRPQVEASCHRCGAAIDGEPYKFRGLAFCGREHRLAHVRDLAAGR